MNNKREKLRKIMKIFKHLSFLPYKKGKIRKNNSKMNLNKIN